MLLLLENRQYFIGNLVLQGPVNFPLAYPLNPIVKSIPAVYRCPIGMAAKAHMTGPSGSATVIAGFHCVMIVRAGGMILLNKGVLFITKASPARRTMPAHPQSSFDMPGNIGCFTPDSLQFQFGVTIVHGRCPGGNDAFIGEKFLVPIAKYD